MAMPGWAIGLGAALEAPKVANNYMDLFKSVNAMRDSSNASDEMKRLEALTTSGDAGGALTDQYYSPATRQALEKMRADKLQSLLRGEAAGSIGKINDIRNDPRFQDPEVLREVLKDPMSAIFGQSAPAMGGYIPAEKGGTPVAEPGSNPYISAELQRFQTDSENRLNRFGASQGDRWAGSGLGKEEANAFKDVATGQKDYANMDDKARESKAEQDLNQFIANNEMPQNIEGWNAFWDKARKIPNLPAKLLTEQQAAMESRNTAPVGDPLVQTIRNGPNSTTSSVRLDMFRRPLANTRVVSSNNPSDREMGLTGGESTSNGTLDVSWIGPDGTPQSASIPRSELPTLKSSLKAQGIKEVNTVDGKRTSRTEVLIKPEKGRRSILGDRPGGAPAAKATGGFTYVNGKLVAN